MNRDAPFGRPGLITFLYTLAWTGCLSLYFEPTWWTNDDIGMSMRAHGWGAFHQTSPYLIFSNIIWGHIVSHIPSVFGVLGYSIASAAALFAFSWAIPYFLLQIGIPIGPTFLISLLITTHSVLHPQFTVTAGLLGLAGILGISAYSRSKRREWLIISSGMIFLGFLIRPKELLLILLLSISILAWRNLLREKEFRIVFLCLMLACAGSAVYDYRAYQVPEWRQFQQLQQARLAFTDFGAAEHLTRVPEIIRRYYRSVNDLQLLRNWFFVDREMANPAVLKGMLIELGSENQFKTKLRDGVLALRLLQSKPVFLIFISAFILAAIRVLLFTPCRANRSLALGWTLCLGALFLTGYLGRPGILWVYYPVLCLLLLISFGFHLDIASSSRVRQLIPGLILLIATVAQLYSAVAERTQLIASVRKVRADLQILHPKLLTTWGREGFPFEYAYPVFDAEQESRKIQFYLLSSSTFAPNSIALQLENADQGLVTKLLSSSGVEIAAPLEKILLLDRYCQEHHAGNMESRVQTRTQHFVIYHLKCIAGAKGDPA